MALIDKCVHYWKLDEESDGSVPVSRADSHGGNTLTDNNTVASAAGVLGNAAVFVASDNTSLSMATLYDPELTDFSVSFWINRTSSAGYILSTGATDNGEDGFSVYVDTLGRLTVYFNDSVQSSRLTRILSATLALPLGVWKHVVITFDRDGNATAWVNGIEALSGDISTHAGSLGVTRGNLGRGASDSQDLIGLLDEIVIFNAVLTPDEIATLYGGGTPPAYPWSTVKTHFALSGGTVKVLLTQ